MNESDLTKRLEKIESRLAQIEESLNLSVKDEAPAIKKPPVTFRAPVEFKEPPPRRSVAVPPPLPSTVAPDHHVPPVIPYHAEESVRPVKPHAMERTIGLKWTGWVGAIVLVIGAGYGIKFAYDQDWLAAVSPIVRLSMMALGGFLLIGLGEWVYRRINKLSATGLFGAGVAVLFLVSYAGHAYYGLYQRDTAFLFMALSTFVGSAVAMRGNLVSIAVLSLVGGNLAPIVLRNDQPMIAGFLTYLLMLQVVALVLAFWGRTAKWWTLRGLSLAGKVVWIGALLFSDQFGSSSVLLPFLLSFAALYNIELILTTWRSANSSSKTGVTFSLLVTTALTIAILFYFQNSTDTVRAIWVLGIAGVTGVLALALSLPRNEPKSLRSLALGYAIQSAALVVLAVPVALSGLWIVAGWVVLSIAFAVVGMWFDLPVARCFAAIVWIFALCQIVRLSQDHNEFANQTWRTFAGQSIPAYAAMSWLMAIVGHIVAFFIQTDIRQKTQSKNMHGLAAVITALSCIAWIGATLSSLSPLAATVWLVVYVWLLVLFDFVAPDLGLLIPTVMILTLAIVKWIVVDTLQTRLAAGWVPGNQWPVLNPLMGTGFLIAGSIAAIYWARRQRISLLLGKTSSAPSIVLLAIVSIIVTFGFSMEIDRIVERSLHSLPWPGWQLKQMAWTMLWSLTLSAFAGVVLKMTHRTEQRISWMRSIRSLIVLLAFKYFILDTVLFRLWNGPNFHAAIFNTQLLTGLIIAASLIWVRSLTQRADRLASVDTHLSLSLMFGAVLIILWAGTTEIDRLTEQFMSPGWMGFPLWQCKHLIWTCWWLVGSSAFLLGASWFSSSDSRKQALALNTYWSLPALLAAKYILIDTGYWRVVSGPALAPSIANLSMFTATLLVAGLIAVLYLATQTAIKENTAPKIKTISAALIVLVLLWAGTLEIDRVFQRMVITSTGPFADPALAEQVALSIFWSIFAVVSIIVGFGLRAAGLRYFALALFAITLLKVVIVDMSQVSTGYRVLSFIGLGGLLLGTSVLYGRFSPALLHETEAPAA